MSAYQGGFDSQSSESDSVKRGIRNSMIERDLYGENKGAEGRKREEREKAKRGSI